jgi:hypothetical protein
VIGLAVLATNANVRANGRFPMAQVITAPPSSDGKTLVMRTTFGVLLSHDGGEHFRWLCEEALGFSSSWDPPIAVTRDGSLYVGLERGLRVSKNGCEAFAIPELDSELVSDLSVEPDGVRAIAITATPGKTAGIYRQDSQMHFARMGEGPTGYRFDTIDVAPSDAKRVYVTGVDYAQKPYAHFFRSDDGGKHLVDTLPKLPADGTLFLSGIDPRHADRVFARLIRTIDGGTDILRSDDGRSFSVVLSRPTPLYGFAMLGDGKTLFAAAGDAAEGLFRSVDSGLHWKVVQKIGLKCLFAIGTRLFGCANSVAKGGSQIYRLDELGERSRGLGGFDEILGAALCEGKELASCAALWPQTRRSVSPASLYRDRNLGSDASTVAGPADSDSDSVALDAARRIDRARLRGEAGAAALPAPDSTSSKRRASGCGACAAIGMDTGSVPASPWSSAVWGLAVLRRGLPRRASGGSKRTH